MLTIIEAMTILSARHPANSLETMWKLLQNVGHSPVYVGRDDLAIDWNSLIRIDKRYVEGEFINERTDDINPK
jgi:hypothetical protein